MRKKYLSLLLPRGKRISIGRKLTITSKQKRSKCSTVFIFRSNSRLVADEDGSGAIDQRELHGILKQILGNISLPESNRIYHDMDTDQSGTITFDEYLQILSF